MDFEIDYVDLFGARLEPAYDLEVDGSIFAFKTPGIPYCQYALRETVIVISRDTYKVRMYSPDAYEFCYTFSLTRQQCERLFNMYLEGIYNG